jgi:hypothetical protein
MKMKKSTAAVIIISAVGGSFVLFGWHSMTDAVSHKPNIIRAKFGPDAYAIPDNYGNVSSGGIDTPKGENAFFFVVQMPDLAPRTEKNNWQFERPGYHDQIQGLFEYVPGKKVRNGKDILAVALKDTLIDTSKVRLTPNGFRVYTPRVWPDPEIHTKTLANGDIFVMRCMQDSQHVPYPSCTVMESWRNSMLTYSFSTKYAEQADIIDLKLKMMIQSFRTPSISKY